jgi:hypothetical protein
MQVNQAAIATTANETTDNEITGHVTPSVAHVPILTEREETRQENEEPLAQVVSDWKWITAMN